MPTLPAGSLLCARNGKNYKWFHCTKQGRTYIHKKDRAFAEQLAYKKYLKSRLKEYLSEKNAIDSYIAHRDNSNSTTEQMLLSNPELQMLLSAYFKPQSMESYEWSTAPYKRNNKYPEQLIHKTVSGNTVRSKSEVLIDMMLYLNKIPFRYEAALHLDNTIVYPDFTIRHPNTGEIYYWEHFGLMDDPNYCKNTCLKLQLYMSSGIIPSIHLITTYETKAHPLTAEVIETTIKSHFL